MDCSQLNIASLNSGSNGNCYFVGNKQDAVLIDAGISCRLTETRMRRLGLPMQHIRAIFISHEHTDHIKGVCGLASKYQVPVYISNKTLLKCRFELPSYLLRSLSDQQSVQIGELTIFTFAKHHDAAEPYSFVVSCGETNVGVFTDIGRVCDQLTNQFKRCHAAFLEANYDDELLMKSNYPYFLKRRISGGSGHLSNQKALELFMDHKPAFMTHLILAHLSAQNNCADLVQGMFERHAIDTRIIVASRHEETEVYHINGPVTRFKQHTIFEQAALNSF
ncbi:MBL fold metallo-hydrolase [Pedobacter faecalis]|uniref:MBL fold metallo-hydrolase n=1 Tax=Pedobacter faecalis TaxID=3041495 RepID=UPI00254CCB72|nr:MBL fold metallo-hydrolase [Pedobacter sp. ELA7]